MIEEVLLQIKVGRSICWESSVTWLWVTRYAKAICFIVT
uniref:Uncharacterized protein n=1 Tax=Triticum urartu TaxID=4572 RepID=A0A8R7QCR0_TRIUA